MSAIILSIFATIVCTIDLLVYFIPTYDNTQYWQVIQNTSGCSSVLLERSFQYRCLQDMAIMMAGIGLAAGLIAM